MLLNTRPVSILNINQPGIYENLKTTHRQIGVILDGDCPKSEEFLIACGHRKFFSVKHHWLITTFSISIVEKFNNVNLNINVDIHIAISNAKTLNWTIIDVYNPAFERGGTLNYTKVGYYNEKQGYNARSTVAKYWTRKNMTGVTFKTMATVNAFCGCSMDITTTKSWGYPTPNGSFDGMVGALQRKAIDFGCSPMFVRADRTKVIDYGRSVWSWKAGFIFRSPKDRTPIEIFLKPLSVSIWLITGLLAILSIIIFKIATTFERNKYQYNKETSWSLCTILTLGVFCQQGLPSTPNMSCGRIATISIFLLSVIIYQFYSASVVSNLLMKPTNKIKTIKDLLDSPLKVGAEDIIYTRDLFAHTKDKTLVQLYYKKIYGKGNTSHFLTAREGIDLVRKGGYAFHTEAAKVYPLIETTFSDNAICELNEVELFKIKDLYGSFQKGSPFRDMIET
ncbi:glutamate receptor 2-like, partial [Asbolus verrucosus]